MIGLKSRVGTLSAVMPGHRRPKDGVPSHTYVPGIHVFTAQQQASSYFSPVPQRRCRKRSHGEKSALSAIRPMTTITTITPIT